MELNYKLLQVDLHLILWLQTLLGWWTKTLIIFRFIVPFEFALISFKTFHYLNFWLQLVDSCLLALKDLSITTIVFYPN